MDSTRVLASVKRRAYLPTNGVEFDNGEILAIACEATTELLLPTILGVREAYLQRTEMLPVGAPVVDSTGVSYSRFGIPVRATGAAVTMVRFQDASGHLYPLTRIDDAQRPFWPQTSASVGWFSGWYMDGPDIVLCPPAPPAGIPGSYIVITYTARPNNLSASGTVQAITAVDNTATPADSKLSIPVASFYAKGDVVDVVQYDGSHEWRVFSRELSVVNTVSNYVQIAGVNLAAGVKVGDWLCPQDTDTPGQWLTKIPMLPDEMHPLLVLETSRRILDSIGDPRAAGLVNELREKSRQVMGMIGTRASDQPLFVRQRYSPMRRRFGGRSGGGIGGW